MIDDFGLLKWACWAQTLASSSHHKSSLINRHSSINARSACGKNLLIHHELLLPLRLCAFARGNLHTLATVTAADPAAHPLIPIKSYLAQSRKDAKFLRVMKSKYFRPSHKAQMNPPNLIFLCVFAPLREAIFIPRHLWALLTPQYHDRERSQ